MHVVLLIQPGAESHKVVLKSPATASFGRTERADHVFPQDLEMSGLHFRLELSEDTLILNDLGSTNGTFVNGNRVSQQTLNDGDQIRAGTTRFDVEVKELVTRATTADATTTETIKTADSKPRVPQARSESKPKSPAAAGALATRDSAQSEGAELIATDGPATGRRIRVRPEQERTIGRTSDAEIAIEDARLSRIHFSVGFKAGRALLKDWNSGNGTFVNGARVESQELLEGDQVRAGMSTWLVRLSLASKADRGSRATQPVPVLSKEKFLQGFSDASAEVRRAAMEAAAWTRQSWLLEYCRANAAGDSEVAMLFAALAEAGELTHFVSLGKNQDLGPARFAALGCFGHPEVVPLILEGINSDDAPTAVAAGRAFMKMTGVDIESEQRVSLPPEDGSEPDEFEAEFLEEEFLPDVQKATQHWDEVREQFSHGTRWCRGVEYSKLTDDVLQQIDMLGRWQASLREHFHGRRKSSPADLTRYPLATA